MKFESPYLLLLLLPLLILWRQRAIRSSAAVGRRLPLLIFSIASLIAALARPYWSTTPEQRMVKQADFIVLLDVSQSMFAVNDRGVRRIDEARNFLHQLLPQFSGSSMSLIYFAGDAQIGSPLTDDEGAIWLFLDSVSPAMTGRPGTDPDRLQQTLASFIESNQSSPLHFPQKQILLLFSDGEFSSSPIHFQKWVRKQKDIYLFTFACGTGKAAVPNFQLTGPYPGAFSEAQPKVLRALSSGPSFELSDASPAAVLSAVKKSVNDVVFAGKRIPLYQYIPFLILSFCLLLAYQIHPAISSFKHGSRIVAVVALLVFTFSTLFMNKQQKLSLYQAAMMDLKQERYQQAIEKLEQLRKAGSTDELDVALGNAYFAQQNYQQAIANYQYALERNPGCQQARWNWEVALKRRRAPQNNPPKPPPVQKPAPHEAPKETEALLRYFDQKEKEQMQLTNSINARTEQFAW